jgi:hypothetical protein
MASEAVFAEETSTELGSNLNTGSTGEPDQMDDGIVQLRRAWLGLWSC